MKPGTSLSVGSGSAVMLLAATTALVGCQTLAAVQPTSQHPHGWASRLPACPCRQPDPDALGDGWALDRDSSLKQHPGAALCFRSYPPVQTEAGRSGQQCCYGPDGALVTSGSAAGTPDRATSCRGERRDGRMKVRALGFVSHVFKDVRPWARRYRQWRVYHAEWPPDNANQCPFLHVESHDGGGLFVWWVVPAAAQPPQPTRPARSAEGAGAAALESFRSAPAAS